MKCKEIRKRFPDLLVGRTDGKTEAEIRSHLSGCPDCRAETEGLSAVWQRLGILPEEEPREHLRTRFYTMLEGYREGLEQASSSRRGSFAGRGGFMQWARPAFQIGFALFLLFIGGLAGHFLRFSPSDVGEISQLRQEVHSMRQMVTLSLLQQQSAGERLAGVSWSQQVRQPDLKVLDALIDVLNHDPNVNVRLAAVDALRNFSGEQKVREALVAAISRQTSPLVQISLIDMVVELKEKQSLETLRRLSNDSNVNESVRQRARWGLQHLS